MILTYIAVGLVVSTVCGALLTKYAEDDSFSMSLAGVFLLLSTGIGSIAYSFTAYSWVASECKADILNREYGTNYTKEEVFFASGVIDTIRELNRNRIEINGNLINNSEEK